MSVCASAGPLTIFAMSFSLPGTSSTSSAPFANPVVQPLSFTSGQSPIGVAVGVMVGVSVGAGVYVSVGVVVEVWVGTTSAWKRWAKTPQDEPS
jgi:hypothetical protein